jgi:hypothetical protein
MLKLFNKKREMNQKQKNKLKAQLAIAIDALQYCSIEPRFLSTRQETKSQPQIAQAALHAIAKMEGMYDESHY